ncbi:MAG: isochorismatase family protein [Verrucomicrobia bacterium]|jgi:nicotinamidase-related amidase|nr:isochorismatase family protein [Verrucomicrobiota bacterium]
MPDPTQHLGLLIIDLQDGFLKAIPEREALIRRCCFAVQAAELLGVAVAASEQLPAKLGSTTAALTRCWGPNTPVFEKRAFSTLEADGLHRWIEANQIDHLLLAGIETPICVYQTALQALGEDIGVTLLNDCIGERRPEDRPAVLEQLLAMDAHVLPSETIFYSLLGDAGHPKFREFTSLAKAASK